MNPPFTIEEFLGVFAAYNAAIWPFQIVAYFAGLLAVAALWLKRLRGSWLISAVLAILWACNGIGYHYLYFSTINPLASGFAAIFVLQAILFATSAFTANRIGFTVAPALRSWAGLALLLYALLVYPALGMLAGHGLMAGPMFGVAPCPTTIFTIGMLVLARGAWVPWLSIIPFLWSLVGLAAALQLGIPEDLGLPAAGLLLLIALATGSYRERTAGEPRALDGDARAQ
ncbi:MAG: DUF6064 family protein [Aestuariivirga sp.]